MSDRKTVRAHKANEAAELAALPTELMLAPLTPVKKGHEDCCNSLQFDLSPLPIPPKSCVSVPDNIYSPLNEMIIVNTPVRVSYQPVVPPEENLHSAMSRIIFESSSIEENISSFSSSSLDAEDSENSEAILPRSEEPSS